MFFVLAAALASMGPGNIATAALLAPMAMATAVARRHPALSDGDHGRQRRQRRLALALRADRHHRQRHHGAHRAWAASKLRPISTTCWRPRVRRVRRLLAVRRPQAVCRRRSRPGWLARFRRDDAAEGERGRTSSPLPIVPPLDDARGDRGVARRRHLLRSSTSAWRVRRRRRPGADSRSRDDGEAIKRMPWRVIVMVCGVTVLIALARERRRGSI